MFTGIIEEVGRLEALSPSGDGVRMRVHAPRAVADAHLGDSIAVSGVCLTVTDRDESTFQADVMAETLAASTLSAAQAGLPVNIERAVRVGDRLGGHIVQGHVDGTAPLLRRSDGARWRVLRFGLARRLAPLVAYKGSIAVDGVSLTVSAAGPDWFEVSLIPETIAATTLGALTEGAHVNVETDILARHVQRLQAFASPGDERPAAPLRTDGVTAGRDGAGHEESTGPGSSGQGSTGPGSSGQGSSAREDAGREDAGREGVGRESTMQEGRQSR